VVTETFRTRMAADALGRGDLGQLGWLLVEGHESLRVDYRSTIPEADAIVELAMDRGAYGARLTGAGWGGCVVVLAPEDRSARVLAEIAEGFRDRFGREPAVWSTRAASGVRRETLTG
jgi:galactokinase